MSKAVSNEEVVTFIHISDLHLTTDPHCKATYMFKRFLSNVIPNVKPDFVICSGDMCNSVDMTNSGSISSFYAYSPF